MAAVCGQRAAACLRGIDHQHLAQQVAALLAHPRVIRHRPLRNGGQGQSNAATQLDWLATKTAAMTTSTGRPPLSLPAPCPACSSAP